MEKDGRLDVCAALRLLAEHGITSVMIEAGPFLTAALLRADLIDQAALFRAPASIGAEGLDALDGLPLSALTQAPRLKPVAMESVGSDTLELFERR
jgi:diaminohydroxyphosphoribosylaminopyrimidine deaminase/5-amino-6-(5-phosphoribosylamino)uracil reductase